jgi:hypothetical protein
MSNPFFLSCNANASQCPHTVRMRHTPTKSVSWDTFSPAYPISDLSSLYLHAMKPAHVPTEFHSHLLHTAVLTKLDDFVFGTISDFRAVFVAFYLSYSQLTGTNYYHYQPCFQHIAGRAKHRQNCTNTIANRTNIRQN